MDEKVYEPEVIQENPFPGEVIQQVTSATQAVIAGNYTPNTTREKRFPIKKVAVELISQVLNTKSKKILQEFQFTPSGALQVGDFKEGISGDLRISPNGLTARNSSGITTFTIDGDSGDAAFAGQIQTGSLVTGLLAVGGDNVVIDGEGQRITMTDSNGDVRVLIGDDGT